MTYTGQVFVPPVNTTFTTLNTGSYLTTSTVGSNIEMYAAGNTSGGDNLVGLYIAAPSTPYNLVMNLSNNPGQYLNKANQQTKVYGVGWYDGTKALTLFNVWNGASGSGGTSTMATDVYEWSSTTAISSGVWGGRSSTGYATSTIEWFMCRDDGTNIIFYYSTDPGFPVHWVETYSQGRTSYLSSPSHVGVFIDATFTSTNEDGTYCSLNSWQVVSL